MARWIEARIEAVRYKLSVRFIPVVGEPALIVEGSVKIMVVADIHLGIEHELWLGGASVPSQTGRLLDRLKRIIESQSPERLIVLGDLKHNVPRTSWQERIEVPRFLEELSAKIKVTVVPGNHDTSLKELAPGIEICAPDGLLLDGVGYFHGHTRPSREVLSAKSLLAAHLHPSVRLTDYLGASRNERVWVRTSTLKRYRETKREILVLPAFNPLCGSLPLNENTDKERGPLLKIIDLEMARIYLLDGTYLGRLKEIKKVREFQRCR